MPKVPDPSPEWSRGSAPKPQEGATRARLIEQLFHDHNRALVTFLTTRLSSETEARDVAQESYVRLLELERTDTIGFHRAYLFRIAANLAVDRIRKRNVRARAPTRELFAEWFQRRSPDEEALDAAEEGIVNAALQELPEKSREALVRHFLTGESIAQIASSWKLSDRMVRYHIARALAHCRARLDGEGESP